MTQRERLMVLVLGGLALGGVGFAAFTFVVKPILAKRQTLKDLTAEVQDKQETRRSVQDRNQKRLIEFGARSLPPDTPAGGTDFAKREYQSLLERLLDEAKAPQGTTVNPDGTRASVVGVPLLNPDDKQDKRPAYTKVAFKIEMKKADLGVLTDFLTRYYKLNLLHAITVLDVKRDGQVDLHEDKRPLYDRDDLHVTIVTEAVILNGAPPRRTILPVPPSNAAVLGVAGLWAMQQTPSVGQAITPQKFEPILSTGNRNYLLMAARDPFHGTLPEPPPPKVAPPPPEVVIPVKPDYGEFIYYTTLFGTSEGNEQSAEITIRDKINNEDYLIVLTRSGEKVKAVVKKYQYDNFKIDAAKRKVLMYSQDTLEISKYTMSTKHKFTVYGLDGDSLVLGEKPSGLAELTKAAAAPAGGPGAGGPGGAGRPGGAAGGRGGPTARTPLPPADPQASVLGGAAAVLAPRTERFYRWENGQKLNQIVELKGKEAEKAVQRAQSSLLAATPVEPTGVAEK